MSALKCGVYYVLSSLLIVLPFKTPHVLATGRGRFSTLDHLQREALAGDEIMAHGIAYTSVSPCCSNYGCRIVSVVYIFSSSVRYHIFHETADSTSFSDGWRCIFQSSQCARIPCHDVVWLRLFLLSRSSLPTSLSAHHMIIQTLFTSSPSLSTAYVHHGGHTCSPVVRFHLC